MANLTPESVLKPKLVTTLDMRRCIQLEDFRKVLETSQEFSPLVSAIFYDSLGEENFLQKQASPFVSLCQMHNCAAFIAQDSRLVGRLKADGLHIEDKRDLLDEALLTKNSIGLGYGPIKDKHQAMEIGERGVDYLFFGKLGYDLCEKQFNKNYRLAIWWAQIMQIPAILQVGPTFKMVENALASSVEFISLESFFWQTQDLKAVLAFLKALFKT